jgi:hypothetical protein
LIVSRADFLKVCGLALGGAAVDPRVVEAFNSAAAHAGGTSRAAGLRLHDATAALFRAHLCTSFRVRSRGCGDDSRAHLVLAEVSERRLTRNVEQFSLIFHAPPGTVIPDGIHTLEHAALGRLDLFIVPVGAPNVRRTVYQACFSRHVAASDTLSGTSPAGSLDGRSPWRT